MRKINAQYNLHKYRECPVCNNAESETLFVQKFAKIDGISFLNGYNVVSCKLCNFVYASNIPEQKVFDEYYINENKYEHEIEQPDVITGRYENIVQEVINSKIEKEASIIDIGCDRSEILRSLKNNGYSNLTGLDPSIKNIEYLENKGIKGIHGTINNIDTEKQYDVVFFLAVLEHIVDLKKTLETLYIITKLNGILIITVPDMTSPAPNELPFQEFSREHINYFTETSLSNLLNNYGFSSIYTKKQCGEIIGFFRKDNNCNKKNIRCDTAGEQCIKNYIIQSKEYEEEIYNTIKRYSNEPIILWGLGTFTQRLLVNGVINNIVAMVDSNPKYNGKKYKNISIISPKNIKNKEPILLAVSLRYIDAITNVIKSEMKIKNNIIKIHNNYKFIY